MSTSRPFRHAAASSTKRITAGFCAASLVWSTTLPAIAAIANSPLYLTAAVESNVMFMLDDSGSMHWETTPDDVLVASYMFPRAAGNYGGVDYGNRVPSPRSEPAQSGNANERATAAAMRSFRVNKSYYNPAITYQPWRKPAGMAVAATPAVVAAADSFPNASPTAAPNHPIRNTGTRNLTVDTTEAAEWVFASGINPVPALYWATGGSGSHNQTYYPATYFQHDGTGSVFNRNSYTRVEIRPATSTYIGHGRENRTDCASAVTATCTYAEEIQNFANWYTYYRSRILASQSGIGQAFQRQGTNLRVGFGAINYSFFGPTSVDGVAGKSIIQGVRSFSGSNRELFFSNLYGHVVPTSGTPLRRALDNAGIYFSRSDNQGPWANTPGTDDGTPVNQHLQCRQSYTILMTDGYWNGPSAETAAATANTDGVGGPTVTGPGGATYTYGAVSPFSDSRSDTLADVAMYYWKNDLRTDLTNVVPTNSLDVAFWQHMTTFGVGLGVTGSVNPATAFAAIGGGGPAITWPDPTGTNAAKLDDLLHASVNGRGGFFSAADPETFANELSAVLQNIAARVSSSAAVASNSTRLTSNTHLYQALFNSGDWSGRLKAFPLLTGGGVGPEVWDAANGIPAHGARNIKTWNGATGISFNGALGALTASQVSYLRGDNSQELRNGGSLRNRSSVLGDIINADPHFVHNEDFGYHGLPGAEGGSYSSFVSSKNGRVATVYGASNDGMLHAFRASDGVELFAYVPNALWGSLGLLTDPAYSHRYFVDGSPSAWDAYWGGNWKTVMVGSLGAGGKAVYALNVGSPDSFGNSSVLWEYQGNTVAEQDNLGHVLGTVTVARFYDGHYWAVFGNGYESVSGKSVLYMVRVDNPSIVKMIDVGAGGSNGMSTPILVDVNGDRVIDLIYAGDLKGNLWKFDVTDTLPTNWVSVYGSSPLFQAKDSLGNPQPITSAPEVGLPPAGAIGLAVYFGTGQYYAVGDNSTTTMQTQYGIVDPDGALGTNTGRFTSGNHRGDLVRQSIIFEGTVSGNPLRALSSNAVNYNPPLPATPDRGWFIDLLTPPYPPGTAKGERIITSPLLFGGRLIFQTITPSSSPCDFGGGSFLMQVNPATGGNITSAGFDVDGNGSFGAGDLIDIGGGVMVHASGLDTGVGISGGFGRPIKAGDKAYVPVSGTAGGGGGGGGGGCAGCGGVKTPPINSGSIKPRATWRQIQ